MVDLLRTSTRESLERLVETSVAAGASVADVLDAVVAEAQALREAHARNPGPEAGAGGEFVEEPSNDWPAADEDERPSGKS